MKGGQERSRRIEVQLRVHWVYSTKFLTSSRAKKKDMRTKGSREEKRRARKKEMRMQEKKTG